jgi:hypothetical protein
MFRISMSLPASINLLLEQHSALFSYTYQRPTKRLW